MSSKLLSASNFVFGFTHFFAAIVLLFALVNLRYDRFLLPQLGLFSVRSRLSLVPKLPLAVFALSSGASSFWPGFHPLGLGPPFVLCYFGEVNSLGTTIIFCRWQTLWSQVQSKLAVTSE